MTNDDSKWYKIRLTVGANTVLRLATTSGSKAGATSVNTLHKVENPSVLHAKSTMDVQSSSAFTTLTDDANNATMAA